MKKIKINSIRRPFSITLFLILLSVGFVNTGENSDSKKVSVKIKIGNSNCSGLGICHVTEVAKSEINNISGLSSNELYCSFSWGMSQTGILSVKTSREMMSEQTYTQYFSGASFVIEDNFTIPANTIGNKNAITIQSGSYPIQPEGKNILIGLLVP